MKEQADEVVSKSCGEYVADVWYDKETDTFYFVYFDFESDECQKQEGFKGVDIEVDGESIHVYPIGNGSWAWTEV
jgi:hypothetical protein